jgi:hypothetical protein
MLSLKPKRVLSVLLLNGLIVLSSAAIATAAGQSSSPHYQVNEAFFGTGGQLCDPGVSGYSANYCAQSSAGELTVGNTASTNYQAQGGFNTGRQPSLTFIVNGGSTNLGSLTSGNTITATGTFSVRTYLAGGYQVMTNSPPPTNGTHAMTALTTPTASDSSQEQFGINLVANTSPASLSGPSKDPVCLTSGFCNLSNVTIGANYNQPNLFYYPASGTDTLLTSSSSSDETDFTISYLFNASSVTPGGTYTLDQVLVATSTF